MPKHIRGAATGEAATRSAARRTSLRWTGWFLIATTLIAVLIAQRYAAAAHLVEGFAPGLFRNVMLVAHLGALAGLVLLPVVVLACFRVTRAFVKPVGVALACFFLLALLVDTEVYRLYRFHIDAGVMNLLLGGAALETFIFPGSMYLQAALIAVGVGGAMSLVGWLLWRYVQTSPPRPVIARLVTMTFVICLVGFHAVHVWADARAVASLTVQTDVLPLRYAATAKRFLRGLGVEIASAENVRYVDGGSRGLEYPLSPVTCESVAKPPNIVLILIDSWRFDAMGPRVTPNIERFAQRASVFTDHWSGGNATRIGVFSLFYSIPGTYWHRALDEQRGPVFVRELIDNGYDIQVFRSAPLFSPELDRTVFAELDQVRMRSEGEGPAEWDRDLTDDFKTYLRDTDLEQPFFAFLFYDSPHSYKFGKDHPLVFEPSLKTVNYLEIDEHTDPVPFFNLYLNSVNYVDSLVGEALEALDEKGVLEDTLIVITGDHGQEFNDNGANFWGHNGNFSRYQAGVPFIWYEPGRKPRTYHHRTSHFDVMPTVLTEALDCDVPFDAVSVGRPLFEPAPREVMVLSDYNTFAIVEPDRIAVVKPFGVSVFRPPYQRVANARVAPEAVAAAIEQKSRFYRTPPPKP